MSTILPNHRRTPLEDRPLAAPGLISYRAMGRFGWIMIGAKDDAGAWNSAMRSTPKPTDLQIWNGERYVLAALPTPHTDGAK